MLKESDELLLTSKFIKQRGYWINKLSGDIEKTEILFKSKRNQNMKKEMENLNFHVSGQLFHQLLKLGKGSDLSIFIILLTALKLLIYRYTNNEDIVVVSPVYRRNTADTINHRLFIRDQIDDQLTFIELLLNIRKSVLEAYENQDYPYEKILEYLFTMPQAEGEPGQWGISDICCLLLNIHDRQIVEEIPDGLFFLFERKDHRLKGNILYDGRLYEKGYIELISKHFVKILENSLNNIKTKLLEISFCSTEEEKHLIFDFNQTQAEYPKEKTLVQLFEEQVERTPDHTAVIGISHGVARRTLVRDQLPDPAPTGAQLHITYKELNTRSNQLAHGLRSKGVQTETTVGIMMECSVEMIVSLLAILKAGGVFLPIDDDYPETRKQFILEESETRILLTQKHIFSRDKVKMQHLPIDEIVLVDDEDNYTLESANIKVIHHPINLAYIIYTSGTSGKPKGVMIPHQAILNYICWAAHQYVRNEAVNFPLYTPVSFDLTMTSVFTPLLTGNAIVVYEEEEKALLIGQIIDENRVGVVKCTPSHLKLLKHRDGTILAKNIKRFIVGGEELERNLALDIYEKFAGNIEIYNEYGPTEAAVGCMIYQFQPGNDYGKSVPIGVPINNIQIYILPPHLHPVPFGVAGELCISGDGLARGYLKREQLTAEKFLDNPFIKGKRLYRSGDMARRLLNGNIEFLGRIDSQVKILGFRIELGEIQLQLLRHQDIKDAVVIAREVTQRHDKGDDSGDKYLCAYIVSDREFEIAELREYLLTDLPDYMIPSYFMTIDNIPLTLNGKVDKKALPRPKIKPGVKYVPPRNPLEEKLVEIWSDMLGLEKDIVGIDTNFFELGGNSLKVTILISKLHKAFNVRIPLAELFKTPTIMVLAEYIKAASQDRYASIGPVEKREYYTLSSAQQRLYILQQMELESTAYNMPEFIPIEMGGDTDAKKFAETFRKLIHRHESLRTSFHLVDDEPVQKVHKDVEFEIENYDASQVEDQRSSVNRKSLEGTRGLAPLSIEPAAHSPQSAAALISSLIRPFDLSKAPLLRVGLIKLLHTPTAFRGHPRPGTYNSPGGKKDKYLLMVDIHHIISDGVSHQLLVQDFMTMVRSDRLEPLPIQYKDFAQWQNCERQQEKIKSQEKYWLKEFDGEIPVLQLPTDYPRPALQRFEGNSVKVDIPGEETKALNEMALEEGTTMFMVLLALINILFSKLCGQEDIVIGSPFAGRRHADLEKIIGMFVNTLALRNFPAGEKTFREFFKEVKKRTLEAFENQDYQFEDLVEKVEINRDISRNPLFDTMFALHNVEEEVRDEKEDPLPYGHIKSKFDMSITALQSKQNLFLNCTYNTALFKIETINTFAGYFKRILSGVLKDPGEKISNLEILSKNEKNQLLFDFNNTATRYPQDKTLHRLFEEQVEKTPDNIAVLGPCQGHLESPRRAREEDCALTYRELNNKSRQLAIRLSAKGVKPDTIVPIMLERSIEMILGLMAILKSGGAYLPIAPDCPPARINHICKDSHALLMLTDGEKENPARYIPGNIEVVNIREKIYPGNQRDTSNTHDIDNISHPGNIVYVLYTSGSTGKPKGVMIEHRNAVNVVSWFGKKYNLRSSVQRTHVLMMSDYTFDPSVNQVFATLIHGAVLYIVNKNLLMDIESLRQYIDVYQIQVINSVPLMLKELLSGDRKLKSIRYVLSGGEKLNDSTKDMIIKQGYQLYNQYGPTENTIDALVEKCSPDKVTLGFPISNVTCYIFDAYMKLLPVGVVGELNIGGTNVARGYLNSAALTAERFVENPYIPGTRLYKTGDLARWLPGSKIEFLGRKDQQVKIRGFRIELGEIENQLLKFPGVKETVVVLKANETGDKYLCAYIVPETDLAVSELREYLARGLPGYMIPTFFVTLEKIPLTPSGKIHRKALPAPEAKIDDIIAPGNAVEEKLAELWSEVLGIETHLIGINSNFFELGGHSLQATVLVSKIHKALNVQVPLAEIFRTPTIREMAQYTKEAEVDRYAAIEPVEKREYYASSSAQKRLYLQQQIETDSTSYNMPQILRLEGELEKEKLEDIFIRLIARHESFRTSFHTINGKVIQKIHSSGDVNFVLEYHEANEETIPEIAKDFVKPFDLSKTPLIRTALIKMKEIQYILMFDMHHIIYDGFSQGIIINELAALYNQGQLLPLKLQYKDFSQWQNSKKVREALKKQEEYWIEQFKGEIPLLNLPTDWPRSAVRTFEGSNLGFEIGPEETKALKEWALKEDLTPFMLLLAVFSVFLAKITGQEEDIIVGTGVMGRRHQDLESILGMFVNMLALRSHPSGEKHFREFLQEVKQNTLNAFENQDYQFEDLIEKVLKNRDPYRNPLFDVVFSLNTMEIPPVELPGLRLTPFAYQNRISKFDLTLVAIDIGEKLYFNVEYKTKLFKQETIQLYAGYFKEVVSTVLKDREVKLKDIRISHGLVSSKSNLPQIDFGL